MSELKVLHVINSLVAAGAEKLLVDALPHYRDKGLTNDVLLLDYKDTDLFKELNNTSGITIHRPKKKISFYNPLQVFKIKKFLSRYDVVHVHLFPAIYWVAIADILHFTKRKYKLVVTEHSTNNRRRNNPIFRIIERILYKRYHQIVTIAAPAKHSLQTHLGKRFTNIKVIENGIDLGIIKNAIAYDKTQIQLSDEDYILLQVSGFRPPKDQETVIKSILHLPEHVKLVLVGDGPTIHEHRALVTELNLERRVHFLGLRGDVPRLLKTCDAIVLASHFEGLSLASIEGLASGKPFIASNVNGLKEVVKGYGLLFPDGDELELARIVNQLRTDEKFTAEVVLRCQQRSERFSINNMIDGYISVYQNLTSS